MSKSRVTDTPAPTVDTDSRLLNSLHRGLQILEILSEHGSDLGVTELSQRLRMSKAGVYRLLFTLEAHGFVKKNEDNNKYRLGMRVWEIGQRTVSRLGLQQVARPILERLANETGESVHVGILDGFDVVYIDQAIGGQALQAPIYIGQRFPAAPLALGRAVLAFGRPELVESILEHGLERYTEATITDPEQYRALLRQIRSTGYALNKGEFRAEVAAIASPIFDYRGEVIASLSLSGPVTRYTDEYISRLVPFLLQSSAEISRQLGYLRERES